MLKNVITICCTLLILHVCSAQKQDSLSVNTEKVYELFDVQKKPEFPGGETALYRFLSDSITYPAEARSKNIRGMAVITFVVETDGSVSTVTIVKDPGWEMGNEAARVVKLMPKWTPAEKEGKPVRVKFMLPIRFTLQ